MKAKAVRFLEDVLGDDERADEVESESPEDYAERKRITISNPLARSEKTISIPLPRSTTRSEAFAYAQALANRTGRQVLVQKIVDLRRHARLCRRLPGAHDRPGLGSPKNKWMLAEASFFA